MEPPQNHDLDPNRANSKIGQAEPSIAPGQPMHTNIETPESTHIVSNRYLLSNYVGTGTRGEIYEAIDQQISKATGRKHLVSIELLALTENQVPLVGRFANQFSEIVNLPHPNIARSIDFGISSQTVFFTMELLEGASLRSAIDGNSTDKFSENEVMAVIRSTADALTYLHDNGVTHGNLTPDSIFITHGFDVKIVDIASEALKQSFNNLANRGPGPSKPRKPVEDVYGLAAIAYEMLTGKPAYGGVSQSQARETGKKLLPIRRLARQRRKALKRALALREEKRTPSVAEFVEEFGITGEEILHVLTSTRRSGANRVLKPVIVMVAVAAVAAYLQPNVGGIGEKLFNLKSSLVDQGRIIEELIAGGTTPTDTPADNESQVIETVEAEPVLSSHVVQTLENEVPEYVVSDDELLQDLASPDDVATLDTIAERQTLLPGVSDIPQIDDPQHEAVKAVVASSLVIEEITHENSIELSEIAESSTGMDVVFDQSTLTVNESQSMAAISLRRNGNANQSATVIWWTGENTARTDLDYAELGVRTEFFSAGENRMTVYVPIVSDSVTEGTESFYVYAQLNQASKSEINSLEVFVVDDDS